MSGKCNKLQVILICFLSLIPWPPVPSSFKVQCSRENARVVRKIVQSKWLPILEKYHVEIPIECPFHPLRDIFGPQQIAKKQNRPSQWTCGFCGKSFYEERHLDLHFDNRHQEKVNVAEDAVCLADFCDMMRCQVLIAKDPSITFGNQNLAPTDIEVWNEANAYRTALATANKKDQSKSNQKFSNSEILSGNKRHSKIVRRKQVVAKDQSNSCENDKCSKEKSNDENSNGHKTRNKSSETNESASNNENDRKDSDNENDTIKNSSTDSGVDSTFSQLDQKQRKILELQRLKANCKPDEIQKLKNKCERIVRDCVGSLLVKLSQEDYKNMEDDILRNSCWYLTCDRYYEDQSERPFPWGLVFVLIVILSLGLCLCYYIIWVLFDTDESLPSPNNLLTAHFSPIHTRHPPSNLLQTSSSIPIGLGNALPPPTTSLSAQNMLVQTVGDQSSEYFQATNGEDLADLAASEHYIYVSYPPELRKKLLESCYNNRTTRI